MDSSTSWMVALTVDLEDWQHGLQVASAETSVEAHTGRLLDTFDAEGVKATFFVLGEVAEQHPDLIRRIANAGHEIGFHGARHDFLCHVGPKRFAREVAYWRPALQDLSGQCVAGFRAPFFSLTSATQWALDCLLEVGFRYDASLYPGHNDRYGWPGAPTQPVTWRGSELVVFPVPLLPWLRVGYSGGAYLRLLPRSLIRAALQCQRRRGQPGMVYAHPFEVAESLRWCRRGSWRANITRHLLRGRFYQRLRWLLRRGAHELAPMNAVIEQLPTLTDWSPPRAA